MRREQYLAEILRLYSEAPDTPSRPSRRDGALAGLLYRQGVRLDHLAHAIRLATLRRRLGQQAQPEAIHSLAYYRVVLHRLSDNELDPDYVGYIKTRYRLLGLNPSLALKPRTRSRNPALCDRR